MTIETTTVYVGETKRVSCLVEGLNGAPFDISEASFELVHQDAVESEGACEVEALDDSSWVVSALVKPMIANTMYKLVIYYDIYPERLSWSCNVRAVRR